MRSAPGVQTNFRIHPRAESFFSTGSTSAGSSLFLFLRGFGGFVTAELEAGFCFTSFTLRLAADMDGSTRSRKRNIIAEGREDAYDVEAAIQRHALVATSSLDQCRC